MYICIKSYTVFFLSLTHPHPQREKERERLTHTKVEPFSCSMKFCDLD